MWSIEQVESAPLQDLIQFLLESTARRKPFELKFEEIDQDLYSLKRILKRLNSILCSGVICF